SFSLFLFLFLLSRTSTTSTLFPYTTLFRSILALGYSSGQRLVWVQQHIPYLQSCPVGRIALDQIIITQRVILSEELIQRIPSQGDRKSTRLNSSHVSISYAVFCLKKKIKSN